MSAQSHGKHAGSYSGSAGHQVMDEEKRKRIREVIGEIQCSHDFKCVEDRDFCMAEDIGVGDRLRCLSVDIQNCTFSDSIGEWRFCVCPLRIYLARKLMW